MNYPAYSHPQRTANSQPRLTAHRGQDIAHVPADLIGIIGFADEAKPILPLVEINAPQALYAPTKLAANGMTNLTASLKLAKVWLTGLDRRVVKKVILMGDGEPNVDVENLLPVIKQMREAYISIDTIYCGPQGGAGQQTLATISAATVGGKANTANHVEGLKELVTHGASRLHRRQGATVMLIDCSSSMSEVLSGETTRLAAAISACQSMVLVKRVAFGQVHGMQTQRNWGGAA